MSKKFYIVWRYTCEKHDLDKSIIASVEPPATLRFALKLQARRTMEQQLENNGCSDYSTNFWVLNEAQKDEYMETGAVPDKKEVRV